MQGTNIWNIRNRDWPTVTRLSGELGISALAAHLLVNRGIFTAKEAKVFFEAELGSLNSLDLIPGCREAASLIAQTIGRGDKIIIFGDYDADGVTATAVMIKGLKAVGASLDFYVPDRFSEGYDLNENFVLWALDNGFALVITVDCGIKAFASVNLAREKGLNIIVTDHHQPDKMVPEANAVINPKLNEDSFIKELAGVGVALALIRAVWRENGYEASESCLHELLELAAIGTVADSVSLMGCNRIIVRHGLKKLGETANIGLRTLFEVEGLKGKKNFEVSDISFKIAPCINAVGRMGNAKEAVDLLISDSAQEAWVLARKLHRDNSLRQNFDGSIFFAACEQIEQEIDLGTEKVIVLASKNWHPGVIGITAARIVQRYHKPAVLISLDGEIGKGSGRSLGDFDLNQAFAFCSKLLLKYGGHKLAGGFSVNAENIPAFRKCINEYAVAYPEGMEISSDVEGEVLLHDIDLRVMQEIEAFKPFGPCNPVPLFFSSSVHIDSARLVGKKNEHLRVFVSNEENQVECIGFRMAESISSLKQGDLANIVFTPQINTWNGSEKMQYLLSDIRRCSQKFSIAKHISAEEQIDFKIWSRCIKNGGWLHYFDTDAEEKLLLCLKWLKEAGMTVIALFPLQSTASDFEKTVEESYPDHRISRIDCLTPTESIHVTARQLNEGNTDLLVTSIGAWLTNAKLFEAAASGNTCLSIHLGHWGTLSPGADFIREVEMTVCQWEKAALVFGSGQNLPGCIAFKPGMTLPDRTKNLSNIDLIYRPAQEKGEAVRTISSLHKKNLVFVNSGREALALRRKISSEAGLEQLLSTRSYHGGLSPSQKKLILDDFNFGTAGVLVASRNLEPYKLKNVDSLIVCSFPLNTFDFNRFLVASSVYLTYNNADLENSFVYANSLYPDKDILKYAVNNMKHSRNSNCEQLIKRMAKGLQGTKTFSHRALAIAVAIISDVAVSDYNCCETDISTMQSSWRYIEARKEVESFQLLVEKIAAGYREAAAALEGLNLTRNGRGLNGFTDSY